MPDLLDIIRPWPIISTVVTELGFSDVLNLSRTSVECRILLHDFPTSSIDISNASSRDQQHSSSLVRAALYIGQHETPHWRALKAKAQMLCTDPDHKKGLRPKPCRHCSMPICEACIVRKSFHTGTQAYRTRTRRFCRDCWVSGAPRKRLPLGQHLRPTSHVPEHTKTTPLSITASSPSNLAPTIPPAIPQSISPDLCTCTARDGWLCAYCVVAQCHDSATHPSADTCCVGDGCNAPCGVGSERRKVCLWCDLPLFPGLVVDRSSGGRIGVDEAVGVRPHGQLELGTRAQGQKRKHEDLENELDAKLSRLVDIVGGNSLQQWGRLWPMSNYKLDF